jgi:hypothetical protein
MTKENQIEESLISRLTDLKYTYRPDIRDRNSLEHNFREKFQALNRVNLTDAEFRRLLDEIVSPDVFASSKRSQWLIVNCQFMKAIGNSNLLIYRFINHLRRENTN